MDSSLMHIYVQHGFYDDYCCPITHWYSAPYLNYYTSCWYRQCFSFLIRKTVDVSFSWGFVYHLCHFAVPRILLHPFFFIINVLQQWPLSSFARKVFHSFFLRIILDDATYQFALLQRQSVNHPPRPLCPLRQRLYHHSRNSSRSTTQHACCYIIDFIHGYPHH